MSCDCEKCPLCDGSIYIDKFNHIIWCDGQKHKFVCTNNTYQSSKAYDEKKTSCEMCKDPNNMQYDYKWCPYCMRKLK